MHFGVYAVPGKIPFYLQLQYFHMFVKQSSLFNLLYLILKSYISAAKMSEKGNSETERKLSLTVRLRNPSTVHHHYGDWSYRVCHGL